MTDIIIVAFVVVFILGWLATIADLFGRKTPPSSNVNIHIHNNPVRTTKITERVIEKGGHVFVHQEEENER